MAHQSSQLFQGVLATDIVNRVFHGAFDSLAIFFLERCGAAHQNDLHAMSFNGVIGQLSIAFSGPVTQCMAGARSEEHTSELQSRENLVCRLLLEKKKKKK